MPGRSFSSPAYRFGFNGKENDNEVKGITGSQQDYGFRVYDPRLGRFLSVDPLTSSYPWYTPYQFAGNMPTLAIDVDGLEPALLQCLSQQPGTMRLWNAALYGRKIDRREENIAQNINMATATGTLLGTSFWLGAAASPILTRMFWSSMVMASTHPEIVIGLAGLTCSLIDPNPLNDYPGNFDDIARGTKLLFKNSGEAKFILNTAKFDYFFGRVASTVKNEDRSLQNLKDLTTLGIDEAKGGKGKLVQLFDAALNNPEIDRKVTDWGTTIVRSTETITNGEVKGHIEVSFFYKGGDMSLTPEVTSIIPKLHE